MKAPNKPLGRGGARPAQRPTRASDLSGIKRTRITNGACILPFVDGRSLLAKRYRDIADQLVADQGGGGLPEARLQLIRRFAGCCVLAEQLEAKLVIEEPIKTEEYSQLISFLVRVASRIGLDRIPRNVTPALRDYLDLRSQPEPEFGEAAE